MRKAMGVTPKASIDHGRTHAMLTAQPNCTTKAFAECIVSRYVARVHAHAQALYERREETMRTTGPRGHKGERIVSDLRGAIIGNRLTAGQRLPSNSALCRRYGVTPVTVSRAIRRLADDGFVVTRERSGVFVSDRAPHRVRFGLVFPSHPALFGDTEVWTRLWDVIHHVAIHGKLDSRVEFEMYYDVAQGHDHGDMARLEQDIAAQRLAGVIFACKPSGLMNAPIMTLPVMPRVVLSERFEATGLNFIVFGGLTDKALDFFRQQGRSRVAQIMSSSQVDRRLTLADEFISGAALRGLSAREEWLQFVDIGRPQSVVNLVRLLLSAAAGDRPDALFVADDNLIDAVETGLLAAGVRVPDDIEVLAHCNFPPPSLLRLPIRRLGYDMVELLHTATTLIRRRRDGESAPQITMLETLFDTEFEARHGAG